MNFNALRTRQVNFERTDIRPKRQRNEMLETFFSVILQHFSMLLRPWVRKKTEGGPARVAYVV